jgi:hypothetical protein
MQIMQISYNLIKKITFKSSPKNPWNQIKQNLLRWSLGGPLSKVCLTASPFIQDYS